ncbi:M56 family metallopeptidase [Armatimonas sp.]|uniref:M56 family metallopeptidase n=1 Tax=Armatimonas sp. TaxID=1872638 RepID=UPI00286B9218|nr:M56 family metallopeptidase [Armatimonas sp.]
MEWERLVSASLWGTGLALAVALLCRYAPKIPASVRFWLWWAVPAKLLLGLIPALTLALLPAPKQNALASTETAPKISPQTIASKQKPSFPALKNLEKSPRDTGITLLTHEIEKKPTGMRLLLSSFQLFWLVGAIFTFVRAVNGPTRVCAVLRTYRRERADSGVWEVPGMGPLVFGLFRPVIVIPTGLSDSEKRLALAHERAHLTRRDPWLALVPLAARVVFWFLPTVYLAERMLATAREEACDALARQTTGATAREYGALLLKLTQPMSGTLAMASPVYSQLQSRLKTLAVPQKRVAVWPLLLPGALLLPGWRLAERAPVLKKVSPRPLSYERFDLPTLGGLYSDAFAITDSGQVVGAANGRDGLGRATLWENGAPQVLSEGRSIAFAASETGGVLLSRLKPGRQQAQWLRGTARQSLPGLPGFPETVAVGMTDAGMLVGSARTRNGAATRAMVWERGQARALGTLGGPSSQAAAVNGLGWIVGKADLSPTETHAFLYDGTQLRDLGTLGGRHSKATAINRTGQIVGMSETATGERVAFVWSAKTGMRPLPGTDALALSIADDGTVVGQAEGHAALWNPEGQRIPLDPSLIIARDINPRGEIVGQGQVGEDLRGFVLKPVVAAATSAPRRL